MSKCQTVHVMFPLQSLHHSEKKIQLPFPAQPSPTGFSSWPSALLTSTFSSFLCHTGCCSSHKHPLQKVDDPQGHIQKWWPEVVQINGKWPNLLPEKMGKKLAKRKTLNKAALKFFSCSASPWNLQNLDWDGQTCITILSSSEGIHSKTANGCLKPRIVPNPICRVMSYITMFWSMQDHIYDGGPIRL